MGVGSQFAFGLIGVVTLVTRTSHHRGDEVFINELFTNRHFLGGGGSF